MSDIKEITKGKRVLFDPPSGWKFGFPKYLPENWREDSFSLEQWILESGYPEKDIGLALSHSRWLW